MHSLKLIDFSTGSPCRFDAYSVDTILSHIIILLFNNMPASPNDIINLQVMDNIKSKTFTNAAMQILNRYSKVAAAASTSRSMHKSYWYSYRSCTKGLKNWGSYKKVFGNNSKWYAAVGWSKCDAIRIIRLAQYTLLFLIKNNFLTIVFARWRCKNILHLFFVYVIV